ncbi:hypothetical protein [Pontibacter sp. G13]|uniref:hypothetical protein n=1 Tax=Pontibacter sp. G13 TaxID=3074898 RepID=UPI0028890AE0|nr:hypothetical protein [Pontibacter sp. G13]WNJ20479.1 hypothetical protein RJD25_08355 [Pontibacter sp. G13]
MKSSSLVLLLLFVLTGTLSAQNSGYMGRKWIAKANLASTVLKPGIETGVEYAWSRRKSFVLMGGVYSAKDQIEDRFGAPITRDFQYNWWALGLGLRKYHHGSVKPAPLGLYRQVYFRAGLKRVTGDFDLLATNLNRTFESGAVFAQNAEDEYELTKMPNFQVGYGYGYQTIWPSGMVLDVGADLVLFTLASGWSEGQLTRYAGAGAGPNLYSKSGYYDFDSIWGYGIDLRVSVGYNF